MYDQYNNPLTYIDTENDQDTFMAAFSILLYGNKSEKTRQALRNYLIDLFEESIRHDDCHKHSFVKSFVYYLRKENPNIPPCTELYVTTTQFKKHAHCFINKTRYIKGFIYDRFTLVYLIVEYFNIHVVLFEDNQRKILRNFACKHSLEIYVAYENHHFRPLTQKINRVPIFMSKYELRKCLHNTECHVVATIIPPNVNGFKVHYCIYENTEENTLYTITFRTGEFMFRNPTFIFVNDTCVAFQNSDVLNNPYFYLEKKKRYTISVVEGQNEEEVRLALVTEDVIKL